MRMTAAEILRLNGDLRNPKDSEMMGIVRRFHVFALAHSLPYCVVGGMAVMRNGYPRTTMDVDILTVKKEWEKLLPVEGEIKSDGPESCVDTATGVTIDILFADEDWQMVMDMPDPRKAGEYDSELGANFLNLHSLVQLKAAVYMDKLGEQGANAAAKDQGDVFELIKRNMEKFSKEIIEGYHPAVRKQCMKAYREAEGVLKRERRRGKDG
jgi:hypothetical protein